MDHDTLLNLTDQSVIIGRFEVVRKTEIRSTYVSYLCRDKTREGRLTAVTLFLPEVVKNDVAGRGRVALERLLSYHVNSDLVLHPAAFVNQDDLLGLAIDAPDTVTLADSDTYPAIPRAIDIILQVCRAIEAVEAHGLVVREALPEDVVFVSETKIKLSYLRPALNTFVSTQGSKDEIIRTLSYCAPEYIEQGAGDQRSDVYLAGALAYQAVTGVPPFDPEDRGRLTARKRLNPPLARRLRKDCPLVLSNIVARAMAGSIEDRHPTVAELREELEVLRRSLLGEQISSESATKVALSAAQAMKHQVSSDDATAIHVKRPRSLWLDAVLFLAGFLLVTAAGLAVVDPQLMSPLMPASITLPESLRGWGRTLRIPTSFWSKFFESPKRVERRVTETGEPDPEFQRSLELIRDSMNVGAKAPVSAHETKVEPTASASLDADTSQAASAAAPEAAAPKETAVSLEAPAPAEQTAPSLSAVKPAGGTADAFESNRGRLLLDAAMGCDDLLINKLLRDGVPINYRNDSGETALFNAVKSECVAAIRLLISRGVDIYARDNEGHSAYDLAKRHGYAVVQQMLEEAGALEAPPTIASAAAEAGPPADAGPE